MLTSHLPNPSFPGLRGGSTRPLSGGGCPRLSRFAMHGQVLVTSQVFNRCSRHQAGGVRHDFQPRRLHSTDAEAPQHHLVRVGVRVRVRIGVRVRVRLLRIRVRRRSTTLLDVSGLLSLSQLGIVQYRLWLCGVVDGEHVDLAARLSRAQPWRWPMKTSTSERGEGNSRLSLGASRRSDITTRCPFRLFEVDQSPRD